MRETKRNKRSHKLSKSKKSRKYSIKGGISAIVDESQFNNYDINNVEVLAFLIEFLNKPDLKAIILSNYKFINSIGKTELDFSKNPEFRTFVNSITQWVLLDYNKNFFNSVLEIIKNALEDKLFLSGNNIDWDQQFTILLSKFYDVIKLQDQNADIDNLALLEIIFKVLRGVPIFGLSFVKKEDIIDFLKTQKDTINSFRPTIICLLNYLIKNDLLHDPKIRELLKEIIEQLTFNNVYLWSTFKKLSSVVTSCALTITSDATSVAAKSAYKGTIGRFF